MTAIIIAATFAVGQLVSLISFIVVLIKLFRKEGVLKGILGLYCGLYTFIWGWMKHRELNLTKAMAVWTCVSLLSVILPVAFGFTSAKGLILYAASLRQKASQGPVNVNLNQFREKHGEPNLKTKPVAVSKAATAVKAKQKLEKVNWDQKALALWKDGSYSDPQNALQYWNEALKTDSTSAEAYNNRGLALYNLNQHQRAIEDFSHAIQTKTDYAEAYNNRANAQYKLGNYQAALMDYNRSLEANPGYAKARLNRGLAYYQMGETGSACSDFDQACKTGDCDGIQWAMKTGVCQ
jgi:tetratricopeptide (TPR) repeat protein